MLLDTAAGPVDGASFLAEVADFACREDVSVSVSLESVTAEGVRRELYTAPGTPDGTAVGWLAGGLPGRRSGHRHDGGRPGGLPAR
ncbi:hypothetical protein [Corynebacterium sphenisci]|uniref:hypothetical protein n=1 Tax=Corynebacterium sphenisci TaxID=191493 RepID=UPI0026E10DED|nr:hypothetical protein [Corynebacterium sphenisci]MDO5730549.1 hypothetical protein [Corynebacterium sphenisci]